MRWIECYAQTARLACTLLLCGVAATAEASAGTSGKLLLTGGVTQIEGAAGGGLTPWALIGGYGSRDQIGANAFATRVDTGDYALSSEGALIGFHDRLELSYARQRFDTRAIGATLGLGRGYTLEQVIYGAKWRLAGDAVLDQDRWLPQIALGVQYKQNRRGDLVRALGADDASGYDLYLAATKLYLDYSLLLNATLRYTRANQTGLLGFGAAGQDGSLALEGSAAWLLTRKLALGAEFRSKPDQLAIAREDLWWDLFLAWAPNHHLSITLAYVDLGNIVIADDQRGAYLSVQVGF